MIRRKADVAVRVRDLEQLRRIAEVDDAETRRALRAVQQGDPDVDRERGLIPLARVGADEADVKESEIFDESSVISVTSRYASVGMLARTSKETDT